MKKTDYFYILIATIIFLVPMAIYGPHDQEEWGLSTWSTLINAQSLWSGNYPIFWTDSIGLGTPLPIGHRLDYSFPFILFPLLNIRWILVLFYFFYVFISLIYLWKICNELNFKKITCIIICLTFLLSSPTIELVYIDDWPSVFHTWCFVPVIFYYVLKSFLTHNTSAYKLNILKLGLVIGIWLINGHSGHIFTIIIILSIPTIYLLFSTKKCLLGLSISIIIAFLIASEHVYHWVIELSKYPEDIKRLTQNALQKDQFINILISPFKHIKISDIFSSNISEISIQFKNFSQHQTYRDPFIGSIFLILGTITSFLIIIRKKNDEKINTLITNSISFAFISSLGFMFMKPDTLANIPSGMWMFRDGVVFFGILLSGYAIEYLFKLRYKYIYLLISSLVAINFIQLIIADFPAYIRATERSGLNNFKNFTKTGGLSGWLKDNIGKNNRLFIYNENGIIRTDFAADGIYGVTDLTFLGINPFTVWFKSISMDEIYRSSSLGHTYFHSSVEILKNREMFDIYGITHILIPKNNYDKIHKEFFSDMEIIGIYGSNSGNLLLLKNINVWPQSFLLKYSFVDHTTSEKVCNNSGGICTNFSNWYNLKLDDKSNISGKNGIYNVEVENSSDNRIFVTSKVFRDEWRAFSGNLLLETFKTEGGLLGIKLPPNINNFKIIFSSNIRQILLFLSILTIFIVVIVLIILKNNSHLKN